MSDIPLGVLFAALIALLVVSAFFSSSETGMMALNRYRLRHLVRQGHRGAIRASALLERTDRLIGLILLGNNFVNILASSLATLIALRLLGEAGIPVAAVLLTLVVLIFSEVAPKTLAALHPERIAFPASLVLRPLLFALYPFVALTNWLANAVLGLFGVTVDDQDRQQLSTDELRTVVNEAGALIPRRHKRMLVSVLDLENVTVDDIMVPRADIVGVDLEDSEAELREFLLHTQHTRLPLYRGDINSVIGVLHMRRIASLMGSGQELTPANLTKQAEDPYFVPARTPLNTQLLSFQRHQRRVGLVVDEYGEIEGLVTLEDLLEEIVGEFTTDPADSSTDVHPQPDGTFLVDGAANLRDLNRTMHWELPTEGPRTVNGLILEYLESIPETGTSLLVAGYPIEIVHTSQSAVKTARIKPGQRQPTRRRPRGD